MARIENWKKIGENEWQGPKGDDRFTISVEKRDMLYKTVYEVVLDGAIHRKLADFDTKKEAIEYAKSWMGNHSYSTQITEAHPTLEKPGWQIDFWGVNK